MVHPVFHIYKLKKFLGDLYLLVPTKNLEIKDISYGEAPVQILDCQVCKLRKTKVASAKVL